MAYTPMTSRATGYVVDEDDWNEIVDNFAAGVPDIFTTKGDLAVGTGPDAAMRLGVGADGAYLQPDSGETAGLKWAAPSIAQLYARYEKSAAQSLASGSATIVNFETEIFDSDSAVITGASWKLTVPADHGGYFLICVMVTLESSSAWAAGEYLIIELYIGGVLYTTIAKVIVEAGGTYTLSANGALICYAAAGAEIQIKATQNSGSAINISSAAADTHISIARLF